MNLQICKFQRHFKRAWNSEYDSRVYYNNCTDDVCERTLEAMLSTFDIYIYIYTDYITFM